MLYYQKNETMYYQLDSGSITFTEVFNSPSQKRVMKITGEQTYNDTVNRISSSQFEVTDEQTFNDIKTLVISLLS